MRDDMSKVLVESPRIGRSAARALAGSRRRQRNRLDRDGEGAPQRIGMRRDAVARKHFGEHLAPLYRYLRRQVDRPWAAVYGELCAALDRRSVVQAHLFDHVDDHVAVQTVWRNDGVWIHDRRGLVPLADSFVELFVHPRTGILLRNRARVIEARRRHDARRRKAAQTRPDRVAGLTGMPTDGQWRCLDGLWFEVRLAPLDLDDSRTSVYDVVLKRTVCGVHRELLRACHGRPGFYAVTKRQLDGATLRRHGLATG